ncbi:PIG-L deacetylase family protein [Iningainema tapete]|uniref:PIG-L family deacetylase n=1 Tax=Iningainema tapete BLCC-T55 TaxID=2748662 RepID=A0A8J7C8C9_9CYAN|nr:PIG-L family deacetylase [Iningainema tapete]MBD2774466.1 PIG-L family deacetylase [Iningainema tapete BLCC-T55]
MNATQVIKKLVPRSWIDSFKNFRANLLFQWLHTGSKPLALNQKSAMVFSPHQDDETFGCGGMIALKRELGIPVVVTFLTDGHINGGVGLSKDEIIQIRKSEALSALGILGVAPSNVHFLAKPDGALQNLHQQERQQTIEQLSELLKFYQPEEVYVPHCQDTHTDHEATYELVTIALSQAGIDVELLQYPIWLLWRKSLLTLLKIQNTTSAYRLSIKSVREKKKQAIAAYCSQLKSLPYGFVEKFLIYDEVFIQVKY